MLDTQVRTVQDLKNNYAELAQMLKENDHIIITNNGNPESVLIPFEDYGKYEEFLHERYADKKIPETENFFKKPNVKWHTYENPNNKYNNL